MKKHAMVLVMPSATEMERSERFVAAVENTVREYVWAAQWLLDVGNTRLLFSLNVLRGHKTSAEMARPVVLSGQGPQAPTQLCQMLRDEILAWREEKNRLKLTSDALVGLLEALVEAEFEISIVSLADQLRLDGSLNSWHKIIKKAIRLEFNLLRDEEEQVDVASMNVLTLLRAVKQVDGGSKCSIRQLEDHVIELQALVKTWLYKAASRVSSTITWTSVDNQKLQFDVEIHANFILMDTEGAHMQRWTSLHGDLRELELLHFVPLKSVEPTVLCGCPFHVTKGCSSESKVQQNKHQFETLETHLKNTNCAAVLRCIRQSRSEFYLLVQGMSSGLILYRMASAEEVLLPDQGAKIQGEDPEGGQREDTQFLQSIPLQDYNPFNYRSGILKRLEDISIQKASGVLITHPQPKKSERESRPTASTLKIQPGSKRKRRL